MVAHLDPVAFHKHWGNALAPGELYQFVDTLRVDTDVNLGELDAVSDKVGSLSVRVVAVGMGIQKYGRGCFLSQWIYLQAVACSVLLRFQGFQRLLLNAWHYVLRARRAVEDHSFHIGSKARQGDLLRSHVLHITARQPEGSVMSGVDYLR